MVSEYETTLPVAALVRMVDLLGTTSVARTRAAMKRMVQRHQREMGMSFRGYSGAKGERLQNRTGILKRSFGSTATGDDATVFSAGALYARIQELGGDVKPTKGRKFLTVPLPAALTAAGAVRKEARPKKRGDEWHTDGRVPGASGTKTWIKRARSGSPVIFVEGSDGKPLPLWVLRKSVKVPARLRFMARWEADAPTRETDWSDALEGAVRDAVEGAR